MTPLSNPSSTSSFHGIPGVCRQLGLFGHRKRTLMQKSNRATWAVVLAVTSAILGAAVFFSTRDADEIGINGPIGSDVSRDELVEIGGVRRPITDIRPVDRRNDRNAGGDPSIDYGTTPPVPRDANPHVRSVAEALETGEYPERLSPLHTPKPFDREAYLADPQAYLDVVEPGRVWQVAQPGPGIPRLSSLSRPLNRIEQGQSIVLKVKAIPGAPVTFTSFDLGAFENQLTSITVQADAEGVAAATFTGTPGTYNDVNILAGSPMTAGQIKFLVNVSLPRRIAQ